MLNLLSQYLHICLSICLLLNKINIVDTTPTCHQSSSGNFLHLTDMHLDPDYKVGAPNKCLLGSTGLGCCRKYDVAITGSTPAGKWGDKGCDLPFVLFNETLSWINTKFPDLDFVLYGGDTVGHHDISQSKDKNIKTMNTASSWFYKYFGHTQFIPNQGNHDTYPIDQTLPYLETSIRKAIAEGWLPLIGYDNADMFTNNGFFKTRISSTLHVISINSIDYDGHNIFRKKTINGDNQDKWLNNSLTEIRNSGESAFILGHIFPTSGESTPVYNTWLQSYLLQFKDVIKGTFFGHSHNDEFRFYQKDGDMAPPILVSPSLMADQRDPCFRIYNYDRDYNTLLDYRQYCVNLDITNQQDQLQVYLDYTFSLEYGLPNITATSYKQLVALLNENDNAIKYCEHFIGLHSNNKKCDIHLAKQLVGQLIID